MSVKQKTPKWMKLEDGESLLHTYLLNETNILVLLVVLIASGVASVVSDLVNQRWDIYGYISFIFLGTVPALIGLRGQIALEHPGAKFHLTSKRIVVETNFKWKWIGKLDETMLIEIQRKVIDGVDSSFKPKWIGRLEEIVAIEIKRKIIGGIVKVRFNNPEAPVISAYSIFPTAMAKEIQAACANASGHEAEDSKVKGEAQ